MEPLVPIPDFQPLAFPAPVWFLKTFLVVGFYLHALPMNVALTGGIIAAILMLYGQKTQHPYAGRFGNTLAKSLPYFVSVAITQGIVPLLFLQLTYGPLFYTSSILVAAPWLAIIFLLLSAYYAYYVFTYRQHTLKERGTWVLMGAGLLFLTVAFFFSNNMTLMLTPERWVELYRNSPYGLNLNWGDPQLIPRYLHFVTAAVAVTGLTMGCYGLYWHRREQDYGTWLIRHGAGLYIVVTLLQVPIGIWFLLSLTQPVYMQFLGGDWPGTLVFLSSMGLDVVGLIAMALAWRDGNPGFFKVGLGLALAVIFLMVVIRHLVRVYFVQDVFTPDRMAVEPQYALLALFLVSFALGIAYTVWLLKLLAGAYPHRPGQPMAQPES